MTPRAAACVGLSGPPCAHAAAFEHADGRRVAVMANALAAERTVTVGDDRRAWSVRLPARSFATLAWAG